MPYKNLSLPKLANRPFFYTSFAQTIDGKVYINKKGYWPIASKTDYETFTYLRSYADVIIDGKNTAIRFAKYTIDTIHSDEFKKLREKNGKVGTPKYLVLTKHPDETLTKILENPYEYNPTIFQKEISELVEYLKGKNAKAVFVDGGPHVIASLLRAKLLDEFFITISPRIFGNTENLAITMVEGLLLEPDEVKLELLSTEIVENELYLRYKVIY
ncbi:MAG: dihydrofolate reductase family protein [Candidatus Levyibacteriota bacterium]|nr:MAG: dihydrofolate reductase family protein [Candidatus Levybacteria bacterium]